jgi:hypothetical protein
MKYRFKTTEIGVFRTTGASLQDFGKDTRVVGLTMGEFSLIDLIHAVLQKTGPASVIVATWSAGIKDAHQVRWMIDTDLITDFKILTDHSYVTRQAKYAASLEDLFGIENIRTSEMHAKFVLIQNDEFKVAITSSMNLNANKTCELFEVEEGSPVFDMLENFCVHHFDNLQKGFVKSASKVNACVSKFFETHETKERNADDGWGEAFKW